MIRNYFIIVVCLFAWSCNDKCGSSADCAHGEVCSDNACLPIDIKDAGAGSFTGNNAGTYDISGPEETVVKEKDNQDGDNGGSSSGGGGSGGSGSGSGSGDTDSGDTDSDDTDSGDSGDQCCTDKAAIAACWWQDAVQDGVTCSETKACPNELSCDYTDSKPESGEGLCACTEQSHCTGIEMNGICVIPEGETTGVCGPSFCNGFKRCSCWGGCEDGKYGGELVPEDFCSASVNTSYCCEGDYPGTPGTDQIGYCGSDPACPQALEGDGGP